MAATPTWTGWRVRCTLWRDLSGAQNVATWLQLRLRPVLRIGPTPERTAMNLSTVTSRAFNQDTSGAKRASMSGPVFITDRGRPAHVLLSMTDYLKLTQPSGSIADMLGMPGIEDIDLDLDSARAGKLFNVVDFD